MTPSSEGASEAQSPTILMLVIHAPLHASRGRLFLDSQACNGLGRWLDNFDRVILCAPLIESETVAEGLSDLGMLVPAELLEIHPLPVAFTPLKCLRVLRRVTRLLSTQISRATHHQFAIGGSWGDWGALAALIAARHGVRAAIWTDRVESEVMRFQAHSYRGVRYLHRRFNAWLAERLERFVIRRSALGLFHGMDTYRAYARFSPDPQLAHDIHLGAQHRIDRDTLRAKAGRRDPAIRIVYAGRVHPDKGPLDWVQTLRLLAGKAVFRAVWYGEGPWLAEMRERIVECGMADCVSFPGNCNDREMLLAALRDADLFLFCHRTPESPRCLIEALLSGTPIVGYESSYASDLIAAHGGGVLTPHDPRALADAILRLAVDRERLAALYRAAAADGFPMVDSAVFRHRSDLIRRLR